MCHDRNKSENSALELEEKEKTKPNQNTEPDNLLVALKEEALPYEFWSIPKTCHAVCSGERGREFKRLLMKYRIFQA